MKISIPAKVKCRQCGKLIDVWTEMECVATNERNMGTEYEMEGIFEDICPKCNISIYVKIEAWEYPSMTVNHYNVVAENAEVIKAPEFSFDDDYYT